MTHHDIPKRWQRIAWAIGAHDLATDVDESDLEFTAWAEATHGHTARLALVIAQAIGDTAPVHNHGPAEGRGLNCPESVVNGRLRGACIGRVDEPEQWPTASLIVADWQDGGLGTQGRGLLVTDGPAPSECYVVLTGDDDYDGYRLLRHKWDGDTLTNIVPVKPVPVAELDALRASIKALGYGPSGTTGMPGSLLDTATRLIAATDELGLDQ